MTRCAAPVASLLLAVAVAVPAVRAGERRHVVRPGESASAIAAQVYGDAALGALLLRYNGRAGTLLRPGETLRIPLVTRHVVRAGETWSQLSQRTFGSASQYPVLAELNDVPLDRPLSEGQVLRLPVVLHHRLRRGETLALLARRFYGDPARAALLARFNRIGDPRALAAGTEIGVPLLDFEPVARTMAPPDTGTAGGAPEARFARDLEAAIDDFRGGDFERALARLGALRPRFEQASAHEGARFWRWLAFTEVAFGHDREACAAWRRVPSAGAARRLDPDLVSPKIRTVLSGCGGS